MSVAAFGVTLVANNDWEYIYKVVRNTLNGIEECTHFRHRGLDRLHMQDSNRSRILLLSEGLV